MLIVSCYVDNTLIAGQPEWIASFKNKVKERFNIKELGKVQKHLGIHYDWIQNNGSWSLVASMDDLAEEIVRLVKDRKGGHQLEPATPQLSQRGCCKDTRENL